MTVNPAVEDLYSKIELVSGVGRRQRGKLCIMSFVALLAGESHSDTPETASPLIRRFAVTLNDLMDDNVRQRLKCFAPRILNTCDDQDGVRADMLIEATCAELLPRIARDFPTLLNGKHGVFSIPFRARRYRTLARLRYNTILLMGRDASARDGIAVLVARLVACCATTAPLPDQREWYWAEAIDLLDRLCDIRCHEDFSRAAHPASGGASIENRAASTTYGSHKGNWCKDAGLH